MEWNMKRSADMIPGSFLSGPHVEEDCTRGKFRRFHLWNGPPQYQPTNIENEEEPNKDKKNDLERFH